MIAAPHPTSAAGAKALVRDFLGDHSVRLTARRVPEIPGAWSVVEATDLVTCGGPVWVALPARQLVYEESGSEFPGLWGARILNDLRADNGGSLSQ
ncbi:hypothetical protein GCM10022286_30760 [Gryllotalpicola daejeonensis]|uniref:Uncharacterized protein n=1 Tax=Gryllotalpicola daejeonensis TaxID=993087 RepID=A0ABP7ZNR8_9MICO